MGEGEEKDNTFRQKIKYMLFPTIDDISIHTNPLSFLFSFFFFYCCCCKPAVRFSAVPLALQQRFSNNNAGVIPAANPHAPRPTAR